METVLSIGYMIAQAVAAYAIFGSIALVACAPLFIPIRSGYDKHGVGTYETWKPCTNKERGGVAFSFLIGIAAVLIIGSLLYLFPVPRLISIILILPVAVIAYVLWKERKAPYHTEKSDEPLVLRYTNTHIEE